MFVTFVQNNSGGYYIKNKDVDKFVIIEGESLEDILNKANHIFKNYREYCECCGERWDDYFTDEEDLDKEPMIFNESAYNFRDSFYKGCKALIYRIDGAKEVIEI